MENKQFLVFETLQDGASKTFNNYFTLIKGFLFSVLAAAVVVAGVILVNWSLIVTVQDLFPSVQAIESCSGNIECQKALIAPLTDLIVNNGLIIFMSLVFLYIFFAAIWLGYTKYGLKVYDDNTATFQDMFPSLGQTVRFLVTCWVYILIVCFGLCLLVFPGIYWAIRFSFFRCAILDKNAGIFESLKASWYLTRGYGLKLWVLMILIMILYSVSGFIPFSSIITMPLVLMIYVCAYRKLSLAHGVFKKGNENSSHR